CCSMTSLLMIPVAIFTEGIPVMSLSEEVWASLVAIAILSTAVAYLLYFKILVRAGASNLMLVTVLIPPIAVTLSVVFPGEKLGLGA
ncbi:MAG: drug/metabolite transporter (DMT)-like permease, partial [Porticoccaceae bacterium]